MAWPESNPGLAGLSFDEHDLLQSQTDLHAKTLLETSLRYGKTAHYFIPPSILEGNGPYELKIPSTGMDWTDMTSGKLYGKYQVKKIENGEEVDCDDDDDYSTVNLTANSIWKQMELYIGNQNVIDNSTSLYHYKSFIETLLSFGFDSKSTFLQTAQYFRDYAETCTQNKKVAGDTTSGYARRKALFERSQVVPYCTTLSIDFLNSPRWLPPGIPMRLKMIRNDDNFVIVATEGQYRIKLLELFVEFRKISVDAPIMKRELAALERGEPYKFPYLMSKIFVETIPAGRHSFSMPELFSGNLPRQVIVGFVRHDSFNSDLTKNGYVFENLDINSFSFKLNNENHPSMEYRPNFKAKPVDCVREYQHLLDSIGIKRHNTGVGIKLEDYATNCCFWALDLTPEQCNNSHVHLSQSGTIGVSMTFKTPTPTAYELIAYGVYPMQAHIDEAGNCKLIDNV